MEFEENEFDELETDPLVIEYVPQESRYFKNAFTIEYEGSKMFDIPQVIKVEPDNNEDELFVMVQSYAARLDKVANDFYSDPKYWWIIAINNDIDNPFKSMVSQSLRIPSLNDLLLNGVI